MSIEASVIEDSSAPNGVRLTTLQLRYPRFIHPEFMTHRVFSRNASSSRAIPTPKLIEQVRRTPAMPVHWGRNQPGMQAEVEVDAQTQARAEAEWRSAAEEAAYAAVRMHELGVHKQVVNRLLEPFLHIEVIVTATEWSNFFALRAHPDAQPEIHALALAMRHAMNGSRPRTVNASRDDPEGWHLPYIAPDERKGEKAVFLAKVSAARCARVSYLTHAGEKPNIEKDLVLFQRLIGAQPPHASPVEHQAFPLRAASLWSRNLRGWRQFRSLLEEELL